MVQARESGGKMDWRRVADANADTCALHRGKHSIPVGHPHYIEVPDIVVTFSRRRYNHARHIREKLRVPLRRRTALGVPITLNIVVLPAPFGPTIAQISPAFTDR